MALAAAARVLDRNAIGAKIAALADTSFEEVLRPRSQRLDALDISHAGRVKFAHAFLNALASNSAFGRDVGHTEDFVSYLEDIVARAARNDREARKEVSHVAAVIASEYYSQDGGDDSFHVVTTQLLVLGAELVLAEN